MSDASRRMTARSLAGMVALSVPLLLGGCRSWHRVPLGPGGRVVADVPPGTGVDLRFAAPRRLAGPGLPDRIVRLRGTVERAKGDTLWVRIDEAAPLGGELRGVDRAPVAPVIVNRDVAVQLRERSGRLTLLVLAGVAALVAIVLIAG
jgi:hypothetical protein